MFLENNLDEKFIVKTFKEAWPSILNSCYKVKAKSPKDDAYDIYSELYIQYTNKLTSPKDIDLTISNKSISMNFFKRVGNSKPEYVNEDSINLNQAQIFKLKFYKDTLENIVISFDQEDLNIQLDSKYKEVTLSSSKAKKYELLCNSNTTSPNRLFLKIIKLQYAIQSAAKNLAIDTFSSKNIRNRSTPSIVKDEKGMVRDITDSIQFSPEQEIIIGKKPLTPEQKMVENLDNARKNKKIKEIKKYINDKMETKKSQSIYYFMQGLSYEEIAKLMNISNGRARQLRCRAIQELARQFKGMKIESF